jgi:hypothetical protein
MVAQTHEGIWTRNAYQHSPVLTVAEATKPSMTQYNDTLEDSFWQSVSPNDGLSEEELTDEAEEDTLEEMARVPSQDFRFYHEGQRLKDETMKELHERMAAMRRRTDPSSLAQPYTYLSFKPHDSDDDCSKYKSGSCSPIVVLSDFDESYSEVKTNSSHSTVPTRPPLEDGSPARKSSGSFRSISRPQSRSRKTPIRKTISCRSETTLSSGSSLKSKGASNKSKRTQRREQSSPSIPKLQRAFSSQTGQTTISSDQGSTRHAGSSSLSEKKGRGKNQLSTSMPRRRNTARTQSGEDENLLGKWQRRCETLWAPFFFEIWEEFETKDVEDDATLTTHEEELSYEDEGNVNVLVAIQVSGQTLKHFETLIHTPNLVLDTVTFRLQFWGQTFPMYLRNPKKTFPLSGATTSLA